MKTVMIISDATGETAERMVRAATLQFEVACNVRTYSRVRLENECEEIIARPLRDKDCGTHIAGDEPCVIRELPDRHSDGSTRY